MGFFNFFYKISYIFNTVKRNWKILLGVILFVFFIFFMSNVSFGFTVTSPSGNTTFDLPVLPSEITNSTHFMIARFGGSSNRYNMIVYFTNDSDFDKFIFVNSNNDYVFNIMNKNGSECNRFIANSQYNTSTNNYTSWSNVSSTYGVPAATQYTVYYCTDNIYRADNSIYYNATSHTAPQILLSDTQLANGDWDYFDISFGDASLSSTHLKVYDYTNSYVIFDILLDDYSDYIERKDLSDPFSELIFRIPKEALPKFSFTQGLSYQFLLEGIYSYSASEEFSISRSVTCTTTYGNGSGGDTPGSGGGSGGSSPDYSNQLGDIQGSIDDVTNSVDKVGESVDNLTNSIDDMNNFFQDDSFDEGTISGGLPSNDNVNDVTSQPLDIFFTNLRDAFTSTETKDFVFTVPIVEKDIVIPADLISSRIPEGIKSLIQMVYWYIIARFIFKDITNYIDKLKSGDITNGTDTNIKADML